MPEDTRHSSQHRLLVLLDCLATRPHTVRELAAACGCAESVARRDLRWLAEQRSELRTERDGRHLVYVLAAPDAPPNTLFPASAFWMLLAAHALGTVAASGTRQLLDQVMNEAVRKLGPNAPRKVHALGAGFQLSDAQAESFDEIVEALCYEQRLRLRYQAPGRPERTSIVEPLSLILWADRIYLVVLEPELGDRPSIRRMDRVVEAERLAGDRFVYPPVEDYSPGQLLGDSLGPFVRGTPTTVTLRFWGEDADIHRTHAWPVPHRTVSDDPLIVELETAVDHSLMHFVLRLGDGVEVLAPEALRQEVRARLTAALDRYGRPSPSG